MLHEEEFFDAIDATLDKWDKEEEKVLATLNQIVNTRRGRSRGGACRQSWVTSKEPKCQILTKNPPFCFFQNKVGCPVSTLSVQKF